MIYNVDEGLLIQNALCQALADHDMYRPTRNEWIENNNTHVIKV